MSDQQHRTARSDGICDHCGGVIEKGSEYIWYGESGKAYCSGGHNHNHTGGSIEYYLFRIESHLSFIRSSIANQQYGKSGGAPRNRKTFTGF